MKSAQNTVFGECEQRERQWFYWLATFTVKLQDLKLGMEGEEVIQYVEGRIHSGYLLCAHST